MENQLNHGHFELIMRGLVMSLRSCHLWVECSIGATSQRCYGSRCVLQVVLLLELCGRCVPDGSKYDTAGFFCYC